MTTPQHPLDRLEHYYDSVPRAAARAEEFGPLTLFVREGPGWPYYARPALGRPDTAGAADVDRVRARQRELGVPEAFEWVADVTPGLRRAVEASGLRVHEHPLMVRDRDVALPDPHPLRYSMHELTVSLSSSQAVLRFDTFRYSALAR
ncbi:hypothetical protein ABZS63_31450, partial [Streptomyces sp. NPDC005568]